MSHFPATPHYVDMKLGLATQYILPIALVAIALPLAGGSPAQAGTGPEGGTPTPPANDSSQPGAEKVRFTLGVGVGVATRNYLYPNSESVNSSQFLSYSSSVNPFVRVYGQVYPLSQFPGLGLAASYDKQRKSSAFFSDSNSVTTIAKAWQVNLQYRHDFGGLGVTGELGVGGQTHRFRDTDEQLLAQLPSVDYLVPRLGLQAGHKLGKRFALTMGVALLIPVEVGEISTPSPIADPAGTPVGFEQLTVSGLSGFIGLSYRIEPNLRVALLYSGSQYSHKYELSSPPFLVANASDDFRALGLSLEFVQ